MLRQHQVYSFSLLKLQLKADAPLAQEKSLFNKLMPIMQGHTDIVAYLILKVNSYETFLLYVKSKIHCKIRVFSDKPIDKLV